ncbi:MAG: thioredoxin domain-containing protein [Acidobacteria bacterium]|nr:thioredoxin domain-containing protein [Acidobacteriota bacterium]
MANRLAGERSPYLLQHANNPVDWYPWGDEAFAKARAEGKPIFLSIGYSTCHWCHVMEHESFEDAAIAAVLNRDFVPIKVDREERPDIDRVYMTFVQATTGAGGWPMSVWLTPELKPFFGGTYFPPTSRWGRPGFIDVLTQLASGWQKDATSIIASADDIITKLRQASGGSALALDRAPVAGRGAIEVGVKAFVEAFDRRHGGFGGAPKFPRPSELLFLLDAHALTGDAQAKHVVQESLRAMAMGGMRDHVGGGFHRYSVDAAWRVPHFEKMLYDQAQLVLAYLDGAQASRDIFFSVIAEDTLDYVVAELTSPDGAFYSAEDADSLAGAAQLATLGPDDDGAHLKREGAFYVWAASEIDAIFGADAPIVNKRFGIEPDGNAPMDPQGEFRGLNIPFIAQDIEDIAARTGRSMDDVMRVLGTARQLLYDARSERARPHLDDKVITAWNGLMIAAFARAARVLVDSPNRARWREAAEQAAAAIEQKLWQPESRTLLRRYRDGEAAIDGFCEDYACLIWGLLELVQATGDARWLTWARTLQARQVELFFDASDGGWFSTTGADPTVLLRLKEDYDGAEPSAASVTTRNLLLLAHLTGDGAYRDQASRSLERYGPQIGRVARVMPFMMSNLATWHGHATEIAIVGDRADERTLALEREVASRHLPFAVVLPVVPGDAQASLARELPWLAPMATLGGAPAAYVCTGFTCQAPTSSAAELGRLLDLATAPPRIVLG